MQHVNGHAAQPDRERRRPAGVKRIHISPDGVNGRDQTKFVQHFRRADVARVQDDVTALKRLGQARIIQAVSVRDQSDLQGGRRWAGAPYQLNLMTLKTSELTRFVASLRETTLTVRASGRLVGAKQA